MKLVSRRQRPLSAGDPAKVEGMKITFLEASSFFLMFLILIGLSGCQGDVPDSPAESDLTPAGVSSPAETPGASPPSIPQESPAASNQSGLTGVIFSESDVAGIPDEPLAGEMLLAIPAEKAGEILAGGGAAPGDEELRFLRARLTQADPSVQVTRSDAGGNYIFQLEPGEYILCAVNSDKDPPDFPVTTRGCGSTRVPPGEMKRVDISSGFGEILLVEL